MSQTEKDKKQQEFEKLSSILNDANYARSGSEIRNDIWQSLKSGGVSAVQSGIGLTNLMSGGHTGKFIQDNIWDTHKTQENIQSQMSGTAKMQKGQFERAEGFGGKLGVILDNPMLALDGMVQSSPSMVTGGLMGRGIGKLAGINNGVVRSAGGASLEMAGNSAENLRSQNKHGLMTGKDYAAAVGTGVGGAAITYLGGRISKGLGIADVDTMVAGGVRNTINEVKQNATKGGIGYGLAGIGKGAISEGVFEELPQTILETGLENWAKGRSLTKDMAGNAVMGLTSGAGMGAVSGAVSSNWRKPPTPDTDSTNNQTDSTPQPPDNGGNTPLSPDGSPISPTSPNNPNSPNSPDNGNGGVYFDMPHNENQAVGFHGNPVIDTPAIGLQNPIEHTPLDTQADRTDTTAPKTEPISQVGQTQQATPDVPQIANGQDVASEPTPQNTPLADVNPQTFANPQNFDSWLNQEEFVNQYKAQQELNAQKPSERMGLDPNQGSLTRSAVVAVDSGATQAINPQAINPQAGVVAGATGEQAQEGTLARASMQSEPLSAYQTQLQERTAQQEVQAQEAKAVFANAPKLIGKQNYIQNQNERLPTQIMAVEADSLMPSVDNTTNQARDRSRTASRVQVDNIANNLDPMQLTDSTVMGHGSPTISDDGTIIAGNGRTMAIKQAYLQGKADEYRQMLMERADEYGLDKTALAGMKNPVLVKSVGNVGVDKLRQLALNSNETGTMTQSAFENARADVERVANINLNQLKADERGDINTSSNRHIINEFVSQFPIEQQNAMRTSNGVLSKQGLERFENALLLSAYGDNPTTQAILESTDEEVRNVVKAIVATSPTVAKTKQGIQDGITPNDDIASDITEALSMLAKLRREGVKPSDYLAQTNLFGDELSPTGQRLLAFMDANIKSVVKIRQLLYKYYDNLSQEKLKQDDMFGKETQTKQSRLNQALQELGHDQFVQPTTATTATAEQARPTSQASQVNERPEKSVSDEQGIGRDDEQVNPNAKSKPQNLSQEKQSIKEMLPENWDGENIRDNRKAIQAVLDNVKDPSFLGVDTVTNISKDERKQAIENIKRWLNTPDEAQKGLTSVLVAPDNSQSTAETSETGGSLALNGSITKSDDADNPKTTFSAPVGAINPHPSNFELNEFGIVEKPSIIWTGVVGGKTVRVSYSNEYDLFSLNGLKTPFMLSNHSQVISRINEEASTYDDTHNQLGELNNLPSGKTLQSNYKKDLKDFKEQVKNSQTNKENDTAVNTTQDLPKVLQDKKGNPKQVIGNRNAKRLLGENGLVDDFDVVKLDNGKYSFVPKENKPFVEPSQDEINEFIDKALNGNIKNELTLFPAGQKEIDIAKQSGVDIAGMYHTLKAENLRHAINSHGQDDSRTDGKRSQQRSLTVDDLKKIPDVLKNFDELTVQKRKENQSSLVYKKQMADGTIEYVERVIETSRENKPRLLSQTVWVGWRATGVISPRPPQVYTPDTPSTTEVASDDSITNSDKAVKQDLTPSQQSALNALEKLPDSDPKKAEFMDAIYGVGTTDSEQDKKARRELVGRVTTYEMVKRNANKLADELSELGYDVKVADSTLFDNTKEVATQLTAKKSGKTLNVMVNKTLPQGRSNDNVRDGFFVKDGNVSYRIDFNELNIAQRIDNHTDYVSNKEYFGANRPVYRQNAKPTDWQQRMAGQMARLFDDDPALPQFIELANQRNLSTGHKNSLIGSITSYADVQFKKGNALQKDDVIGKNNDEYHQGKIKFSRMGDVVAPVDEQAKVLQGKAVSVIDESTLDMPKVKGFKAIEKWATNLFEKQGGKAINPTLGEIILNHRSVKDSLAHGKFSPYKNIAFAGVKDVLEKGVIVAVDTIQKSQDSFYISAPVLMNGKENILTVIVHRDVNTQSMYLHSVMTKENLMKPRVSETQEQNSRKHIGSLTSSDIHNILQNALTYKEKSKKELIVTHNISADGIIHADKMGGLPFASIAITKQSNPLDGFGEVTLIGDSHMIDPKGANKAKVFGSDIYSPRYPKVIAKVDRKKLDEINNRLQQSNEFLGYGNTVIADDFSQRGNPFNTPQAKHYFLSKNGINVEKQYINQEQKQTGNHEMVAEKQAMIEAVAVFDDVFGGNAKAFLATASQDDIKTVLQQLSNNDIVRFEELFDAIGQVQIDRTPLKARVKATLDTIKGNEIKMNDFLLNHLNKMAAVASGRVKASDGKTIIKQVYSFNETTKAIDKAIKDNELEQAFDDYIDDLKSQLILDERLENGSRTLPHTLENVVKKLKKDLRGGESMNYGLPNLRAKITPQFKSIKDIQDNKDRLLTKDDFSAIKQEVEQSADHLAKKLGISELDIFDFLHDVIDSSVGNALKTHQAFTSQDNINAINEFLAKLKAMPTEYFEVKAKDVTQFGDFKGAVVPNDLPQKARQILENSGLKIYPYANAKDRANVIKQATWELDESVGDVLFQKQGGRYGTTAQDVLDVLNNRFGKDIIKKLMNNGSLNIISLAEAKAQFGNIPDDVDGFYTDGTAYLVHDNIHTDMIMPTFLHELGGHGGLQTLMSERAYQSLLNEFHDMVARGDETAKQAKALADRHSRTQAEADSEYLAYMITLAGRNNSSKAKSLMNRVIMAVKTFLKNTFGISLALTPNDILALSEKMVRNRVNGQMGSGIDDVRFSYADSKQTRLEKLKDSKPIEITGREIEPSDDVKEYRKNAYEYGKKLRGTYTNKDTGRTTKVVRESLNEVLRHHAKDEAHLQSIAAIPQIIENAIYIETLPNEDKAKNPLVKEYEYYVVGLKIDGVDYTVKAVLAIDDRDDRYYDHRLTKIEKGNLLASTVRLTNAAVAGKLPLDEYDRRLLQILQDKNDESDIQFSRMADMADFYDKNQDKAKEVLGKLGGVVNDFINNPKSFVKSAKNGAKQGMGDKFKDYLGYLLGILNEQQLVELYGKKLEGLQTYRRIVQQMDADSNESSAKADKLAVKWGKLKDEQALAELMHDVTQKGIDPSRSYQTGDKAQYQRLKRAYDKLTDDAKAVYEQARDDYQDYYKNLHEAMTGRIKRNAKLSNERKQTLLDELDKQYQATQKVFFPLTRFGDYVVVVKDTDGNVINVARAETKAKADEIRRGLIRDNPNHQVGQVVLGRDMDIRELGGVQGLASEFLTDELDLGDELHQAYLNSLLDRQFANNNVELKGTAGFSTNARRAYAHHMSRGGYHIAKLRHTDRLRTELDRMQKHIDENVDNPDYDHVTMQRVVDEMEERHKILLNPPTNPLSTMATSVGFMWYMGLSPASALVNLSQTLLLAYPMMGAKWGFSKAQKELTQASKDWWRIASWREEDGTISWQSLTHADHMKHAKKVLSAEEYDAVDKAFNRGAVDKTQAHDLAGIASGEDGKVSQMMKPAMKVASVMFHEAEVYNRQATFLASYRLARGAGIDHETAIIMADDMTRKAHFDYSQSNRARYMNTPVAKVVLLFKQYSQNMIFTLIRQTALAMPALGKFLHNRFSKNKRAYTQEELEAAKAISAIFAGHALFAGALGLPSAIVTPFLAAATMLGMGGGDDDDWGDRISNGMATLFGSEKAEVAFRNALADVVGNDVAEVVAKGVPRAVGVDLSSRVGLNNLIVPHIQDGLEGQSKWENFMTAMLGPVVGIGGGVVKGWGEFFEGHELRGIETASPKFFKDYLKAYRYATEGHTTKDGKEIVERENVGAWDSGLQAIGFRSAKFAQVQEARSAMFGAGKELTATRKRLINRYALAKRDGDDEQMDRIWEEIKRFNVKHPSVKITKPALMQSIRQRQRRIDNAKDGIYLSKNREHLREYGAFGVGG